jgi:hypothetical protein
VPVVTESATGPESLTTVFPAASSTVTIGCETNADPGDVIPAGDWVTTNFAAVPDVTVKVSVFETVVPGPLRADEARIVTDPATLPVTVFVATPDAAADVPVPEREPDPVVCAKVTVTEASAPVVTVFPPASSIAAVTTRVEPDANGDVDPVSTICEAGPIVTLNVVESADARDESVARILYPIPAVLIEQPLNANTPLVSV